LDATDGDVFITQLKTFLGDPGVTIGTDPLNLEIPAGEWSFRFYGQVSSIAGGNTQFKVGVYKVSVGGIWTSLFSTVSGNLPVVTGSLEWTFSGAAYSVASDDSLGIKIFGDTSSATDVTADLYYEGTDHPSYLRTPPVTVSPFVDVMYGLPLGVEYDRMIPLMWAEIQKLRADLDALIGG
jgi:hypothetical protein